MQILKNEVRERILKAALEEFAIHGYKNSSLRRISSSANITVGNIYAYYANKDALFEAVIEPITEGINELIHHLASFQYPSSSYIDDIVNILELVCLSHRQEFIIIMSVVDDSKYQKYKEIVIDTIDRAIYESSSDQNRIKENDTLRRMISVALLEGILSIIKKNINITQFKEDIIEYLVHMFKVFK